MALKYVQVVITFVFFFLLISSVSALKTFPQNTNVTLCHPVRDNGGLPTGTTCNITIAYANGTNLVDFLAMDDLTDQFCYNISSTNTSQRGLYDYAITCTNGTDDDTLNSQYLVNLGGIEPSQQRTDTLNRTVWIFFGLAFLFFIALIFVKGMPYKATLFLLMFWLILMGINTTYITIQDEVVNTNIENFFSFFLVISYWANFVIFFGIGLVWLITAIVTTITRKKANLLKDYG